MKEEIGSMARDLAMKGYSKTTQQRHLRNAERLIQRFGRPASELSRDELRQYVEELQAQCKSASTLNNKLGAILFLCNPQPDVSGDCDGPVWFRLAHPGGVGSYR